MRFGWSVGTKRAQGDVWKKNPSALKPGFVLCTCLSTLRYRLDTQAFWRACL